MTQEAVSKGDAPDSCCGKTYMTVSKDKTVRLFIKKIAGPPDVAGQKLKVNNIFLRKEDRGHLPERYYSLLYGWSSSSRGLGNSPRNIG